MSFYNVRFCIACQEEVAVESGRVEGHTILVGDSLPFEVEFCCGPFTTSTPSENFDVDWEMQPEPSPEELELMDVNAKYFMEEM